MLNSTLFSLYLIHQAQGEAALAAFKRYFGRQGLLGPLKKQQQGHEVTALVQETSCGVSAALVCDYDEEGFNDGFTFTVDLAPTPEGEDHPTTEFLSQLHGALKGNVADALKASFMALGPAASMNKVCELASLMTSSDVGELEVLERTDQFLICRHFYEYWEGDERVICDETVVTLRALTLMG